MEILMILLKVIGVWFVGVLPLAWLYLTFKVGGRKAKMMIRWAYIYSLIGVCQLLAVLFPVAWVFKFLGKFNPLWIVLDDTRLDKNRESGLAVDYEVYLNDFKWKWVGVLSWHIFRNRVWNLVELFKVPDQSTKDRNQDITITEYVIDDLYKNDLGLTDVLQDAPWASGAGLKYIAEPGEDIWQRNRGDIISTTTSILGTGYIFYTAEGWESFRYTQCKKVSYLWGKIIRWRTIYIGTNAKRYSFIFKHKKLKPWAFQK